MRAYLKKSVPQYLKKHSAEIAGQDGLYLAEIGFGKRFMKHMVLNVEPRRSYRAIDHRYQDPHKPNPRLIRHYGNLSDGSPNEETSNVS